MWYAGIDLSKRKSQIAVIDDKGELVMERKVANTKEEITRVIKGLNHKVSVMCETGSKCFWLSDALEKVADEFHVAHAYKLAVIAKSRQKTDKIDAKILAELLRIGFVPEVYIPSKQIRDIREVLRGRNYLKTVSTMMYNKVHSILDRWGIDYSGKELHNKNAINWLESIGLEPASKESAIRYIRLIAAVKEQIKELDDILDQELKQNKEMSDIVNLLMTIPGIGRIIALTLYIELSNIDRFPDIKKLWAYTGLVPSVYQSGEVCRGGRLTKQGNRSIRYMIILGAWVAVQHSNYHRRKFEYYANKHGSPRAIVPVARILLNCVYKVWKQRKSYDELFSQKNNLFFNNKMIKMASQPSVLT